MWRLSSRFGGLFVDLALLTVSCILALWLRENLDFPADKLGPLGSYIALLLAAALPIRYALGMQHAIWRHSSMSDFRRVVVLVFLTTAIATAGMFLLSRLENVSRSVPFLQGMISLVALIGARIVARERYQLSQRRHSMLANMASGERPDDDCLIVVGMNKLTLLVIGAIEELSDRQVRVAGIISEGHVPDGHKLQGYPLIGANQDLTLFINSLREHGMRVNRLVITLNSSALSPRLRSTIHQLEQTHDIKCIHLLDLLAHPDSSGDSGPPHNYDEQSSLPRPSPDDGLNARRLGTAQRSALRTSIAKHPQGREHDANQLLALTRRPYLRLKRLLDATVALCAIVLLLPVFALVALLVAMTIGHPIIFWQDRPGLAGRRFRLYKFRTMGDAYDAKGRPIPEGRINAVGHFLRATRLDELPQLWNILAGDMSFVGPRPLLIVDQLDGGSLRHLLRPGLTGYAQVIGGRVISPTDKMVLDVWYVQNVSLRLDLEIMARTIPIIAFGERVDRGAISRAWLDLRQSGSPMPQPKEN